jgi:hypothetical protein
MKFLGYSHLLKVYEHLSELINFIRIALLLKFIYSMGRFFLENHDTSLSLREGIGSFKTEGLMRCEEVNSHASQDPECVHSLLT